MKRLLLAAERSGTTTARHRGHRLAREPAGAQPLLRRDDGDPRGVGWANELRRNEALRGGQDGFLVEATTVATTLLRNYVHNFGDDGIDVRAASSRLGANIANGNGALGIRAVPGVTDLGGNQAALNGDPAQCVNVACD